MLGHEYENIEDRFSRLDSRSFYVRQIERIAVRHGFAGLVDWRHLATLDRPQLEDVFDRLVDSSDKRASTPLARSGPPRDWPECEYERLAAARAVDEKLLKELMDEADMADEAEIARMLGGISSSLLPRPLKVGRADLGYRYPRSQISPQDGRIFPAIEEIREIVTGDDAIHVFLSKGHSMLGGRTGYEALQDGDDVKVVNAAWDYFVS